MKSVKTSSVDVKSQSGVSMKFMVLVFVVLLGSVFIAFRWNNQMVTLAETETDSQLRIKRMESATETANDEYRSLYGKFVKIDDLVNNMKHDIDSLKNVNVDEKITNVLNRVEEMAQQIQKQGEELKNHNHAANVPAPAAPNA